MKKLFSVFFVMTVFCFGADNSVNDVVPSIPELTALEAVEQAAQIHIPDADLIKKGSCIIYLDATLATEQEKEAAYQAVEGAISNFEGKVPDSISINIGISNLELVDSASYDDVVDNANQESDDRVIAVKDIKILEVIIDIACDQATQEEKTEFFNTVSTVLSDLCAQFKEVANSIHGTISFESPDLLNETKSGELDSEVVANDKGLLDGAIDTAINTVLPIANQIPVGGSVVNSVVSTVVAPVVNQVETVDSINTIPAVDNII